MTTGFGITPAQIEQIAAQWRSYGRHVADVDVPVPRADPTSVTLTRTAQFGRRAVELADADGTRLVAMGDALAAFDAVSVESDRSSGENLRAVTGHGVR